MKNSNHPSYETEIRLFTKREYRCPYCNSLLLIEDGDYRKRYDWAYTMNGGRKRCYYYVVDCPCCEEEFILRDYENI